MKMAKSGFLLLLALFSCASSSAVYETSIGAFDDSSYGPIKEGEDYPFSFSFTSRGETSYLFYVKFSSPSGSQVLLNTAASTISLSNGEAYVSPTITIPGSLIEAVDNTLSFSARGLTGEGAHQEVSREVVLESSNPIIQEGMKTGGNFKGRNCFFRFYRGSLSSGCNSYVIRMDHDEIIDPSNNQIDFSFIGVKYSNPAGNIKGNKAELRLLNNLEDYPYIPLYSLGTAKYRYFQGSLLYKPSKEFVFLPALTYAVDKRNLLMRGREAYDEDHDFLDQGIYLPSGVNNLNKKYEFQLVLSHLGGSDDYFSFSFSLSRTREQFSSLTIGDYHVEIGA